jgi:CYTH domain-containing protein
MTAVADIWSESNHEVELKFIVRRENTLAHQAIREIPPVEVDQLYLSEQMALALREMQPFQSWPSFWDDDARVRHAGSTFTLTVKRRLSSSSKERLEVEVPISADVFEAMAALEVDGLRLRKLRRSKNGILGGVEVHMDLDEYTELRHSVVSYDFLVCELEIPLSTDAAKVYAGISQSPEWSFLRDSIEVTGQKAWTNRNLAKNGIEWRWPQK